MPDEVNIAPTKVRFIYVPPNNREEHFINGVYGGLTPRGEIICNFFFEYKEVPDSEEYIVKNNQLEPVKPTVQEPEFIREIKSVLILNSVQAREIAEWLNGKADECDKRVEGKLH